MGESRQQTLLLEEEAPEVTGEPHAPRLSLQILFGSLFYFKTPVLFTVLISGFSNVVVNDSSVDFREAVCVLEGVGQKEAALGFDRRVNEFCCV